MKISFEILLGVTKAGLYVVIAELFWGRARNVLRNRKTLIVSILIATLLGVSNYHKNSWLMVAVPIAVVVALIVLGMITEKNANIILLMTGAIESYVTSFWFSFINGMLFAILSKLWIYSLPINGKYALTFTI